MPNNIWFHNNALHVYTLQESAVAPLQRPPNGRSHAITIEYWCHDFTVGRLGTYYNIPPRPRDSLLCPGSSYFHGGSRPVSLHSQQPDTRVRTVIIMCSTTHYTGELLGCLLAAAPRRGTANMHRSLILTPRTRTVAESSIFLYTYGNMLCVFVCSAVGIFYRLNRTNLSFCI